MRHLLILQIVIMMLVSCVYNENGCSKTKTEDLTSAEVHQIKLNELSHLFNLTYIKETTPNYTQLRVTLKETKKGVGVFATKPIKANEIVLFYKLMVQYKEHYHSPFQNTYTFNVYGKNGVSISNLTSDIFEQTIEKPKKQIAFWGHLVNEPDENQIVNLIIDVDMEENYKNKDQLNPGDVIIYKFITFRTVKVGEELTWCYGPNYKRNYKTSC